jgi:uncharacterized alkaline shock family protein YloU
MEKKTSEGKSSALAGDIPGSIQISQDVVETIAGLAAREIEGIYSLGKSQLISLSKNGDPKRGISAEVGQKETALDLEVVIEYGYDIRVVANKLRQKVAQEVDRMAGRTVVEVTINVIGLHIPTEEEEPVQESRVK